MPHYDAIVVGLRCAGAPLAMLLARAGLRVLGIDRASFPSDTMSTHFLWPRTTSMLASWGLLDRLAATGCPPIESVLFDVGPVAMRGRPDAVDGTAAMFCPRRHVLDTLLVEAARGAGAVVHEATTLTGLLWEDGRVVGAEIAGSDGQRRTERAGLVVGADGLWSRVARAAGAAADVVRGSLSCGYYAYWDGVPVEGVEFYRRHNRVILAFPTHAGRTCLYVGWPEAETAVYREDVRGGYLGTLDLAPDLARRVAGGAQAEPLRGSNKLPNQYRACAGPGWALVGDAAVHRDPITGMGIADAFLGARLLADAIAGGGTTDAALAGYQVALREQTRAVFDYTVLSAQLDDPAPLLGLYAAVAERPEETQQLMNVLAGTLPFRAFFNRTNIARLTG